MEDTKNNTGAGNTGYRNTGDRNTGNCNTGDRNTGDRNTGERNTGDRNTGYRNTGDRNTGYRNTGYLNSKTPKVVIFDVQTDIEYGDITFPNYFYFNTLLRIYADDMKDEEKKEHPEYKTTNGYLKKLSDSEDKEQFMKDCWKLSFDKAEVEDVRKTLDLPHFDYGKFEAISGITKEMFDRKLGKIEE